MKTVHLSSVQIKDKPLSRRVLRARIPLRNCVINTLTQVRQTMTQEDTADLAQSILSRGQLVAGRVVALRGTEARQYVSAINDLFNSSHDFPSMKKVILDTEEYYFFLVYGHRRFAACKQACKFIKLKENAQSEEVFDNTFLCDIHFDLTIDDVIPMQLTENQYVPVPKHEEVTALWRYWRYCRKYEKVSSVSHFARLVGRSPAQIRDMLRFTSLPEEVQQRINPASGKAISSYSLLLQVARLVEAHRKYGSALTEAQIINIVDLLTVRRVSAADFSKEVSHRISQFNNGQEDLFGGPVVNGKMMKRVAAANVLRAVLAEIGYLNQINELLNRGLFDGGSPYHGNINEGITYSTGSPARMVLRMVDLLRETAQALADTIEGSGAHNHGLSKVEEETLRARDVFTAVAEE